MASRAALVCCCRRAFFAARAARAAPIEVFAPLPRQALAAGLAGAGLVAGLAAGLAVDVTGCPERGLASTRAPLAASAAAVASAAAASARSSSASPLHSASRSSNACWFAMMSRCFSGSSAWQPRMYVRNSSRSWILASSARNDRLVVSSSHVSAETSMGRPQGEAADSRARLAAGGRVALGAAAGASASRWDLPRVVGLATVAFRAGGMGRDEVRGPHVARG
jgi:hypothetical protein